MSLDSRKITVILTGLILCLTVNSTAQLHESILAWDGTNGTKTALPQTLAETGFDSTNTAVFVPYKVNIQQYLNFTEMKHYAYVPAGKAITPSDSVNFTFPEDVVLMRHVYLDTIYGNPASRVNIEFQMQVRVNDSTWAPLTYVWDTTSTSFKLLHSGGFTANMYHVYTGPAPFDFYSAPESTTPVPWVETLFIRMEPDCGFCHRDNSTSNGFSVQQLNVGTQLQDLAAAGVLSAVPDLNAMTAAGKVTKFYGWDDPTATLDVKILSYLGSTCFNCHSRDTEHQTGMVSYFPYFTVPNMTAFIDSMKIWDVARPNQPDSSLLYTYQETITMPQNGGVTQFNPITLKNVWNWINGLDGDAANDSPFPKLIWKEPLLGIEKRPIHGYHGGPLTAHFEKQSLILGSPQADNWVRLFSVTGKEINLIKISDIKYAVTDVLTSGLYFLKSGDKSIAITYNPF